MAQDAQAARFHERGDVMEWIGLVGAKLASHPDLVLVARSLGGFSAFVRAYCADCLPEPFEKVAPRKSGATARDARAVEDEDEALVSQLLAFAARVVVALDSSASRYIEAKRTGTR